VPDLSVSLCHLSHVARAGDLVIYDGYLAITTVLSESIKLLYFSISYKRFCTIVACIHEIDTLCMFMAEIRDVTLCVT
jgi:hypothetical protein